MKKLYYLFSAFCFLTAITSCQDENYGYTADEIRYETEFIKTFGNPDPNHTWGFEPQECPVINDTRTRASLPNANQWSDWKLDVPYPLTENQIAFVTKWFEETYNPTGIAVNWTDYFAQQVSSTEYGAHMDKLLDASTNSDDHVYNYNGGGYGGPSNTPNKNITSPLVRGEYADRIQYMTGQSTKAFAYHETVSEKTWYDHYVIIPGKTIDPTNSLASQTVTLKDANGKTLKDKSGKDIKITESIWGMYFVGFDYEANKDDSDNNDVARDYYFNDWIIKISPGTYSSISKRVMCEDLGNSFDWDFNDVVFDVNFTRDWVWNGIFTAEVLTAHIVIQAAGGTLPINVGNTDPEYEVHKLFGVSEGTVVIRPQAPVQYTVVVAKDSWVSIIFGQSTNPDASMIPIYVNGTNTNNIAQNLQKSKVPQRFACPTSVDWSPELVCISDTYPKFTPWVKDAKVEGIWNYDPQNDINH